LKDAGDKVDEETKKDVESKIQEVKDALNGTDIEAIKSKADVLGESIQKVGAAMYKDQASSEQSAAGSQPEGEEPKVTVENDNDKKSDAKDEAVEGEIIEEDKKD
jgi:molecular chaperone DnaK